MAFESHAYVGHRLYRHQQDSMGYLLWYIYIVKFIYMYIVSLSQVAHGNFCFNVKVYTRRFRLSPLSSRAPHRVSDREQREGINAHSSPYPRFHGKRHYKYLQIVNFVCPIKGFRVFCFFNEQPVSSPSSSFFTTIRLKNY